MTKAIPLREFAAKFEFFAQEAEREPVLIGAGSDDPLVMITLREYQRLLGLDRKVYATHDLPEQLVRNPRRFKFCVIRTQPVDANGNVQVSLRAKFAVPNPTFPASCLGSPQFQL